MSLRHFLEKSDAAPAETDGKESLNQIKGVKYAN
jgi:hypothetical protein